MTIRELLGERVHAAMLEAGLPAASSPAVAASTRPEFGDFQANGVMGAAKKAGKNPRELAQQVVSCLDLAGIASRVEIAGPGFINITLANDFLAARVTAIAADPRFGVDRADPMTVVVDYSSPNLAKEMHVGHLRSTIIGDALARCLEFLGHRVIRQNHMGDWGTQFGMLIAELEEQLGEGQQTGDIALANLETFYQQAKAHFDADPAFADKSRDYVVKLQSGDPHCRALWRQFIDISVAHSEDIYRRLNVSLAHGDIYPESAYNDDLAAVVEELQRQGLAVESDGAQVVFLDELADKNGNPSPVIIQKSGGGYLYATTDLAAMRYRCDQLRADRIMYFIDARQSLHMKQVFAVARLAGFVGDQVRLEHLPFGTMMGKDGKPFKTRSGGTVKLSELLDEAVSRAAGLVAEKAGDLAAAEQAEVARKVGIGAVKYADLSKTRTNDYIFDWDAMLSFEGNTAPYLQYAYTRIKSIFRKAEVDPDTLAASISIEAPAEKALAMQLLQFSEVLEQVAEEAYPHMLCTYLYELARAFMAFYEQCPILHSDTPESSRLSRLQLAALVAAVMAQGLDLLGIDVMERM
jgi:arginyl-tRNA synthetase